MIALAFGMAALIGCPLAQSETEVAPIPAPVVEQAAADQAAPQQLAAADNPAADVPVDDGTEMVIQVRKHMRADPLEAVNVKTFAAAQALDKAFVAPAARVYEHTIPSPARKGLRNFFRNLHEPVVFINYLIQLKPGKAIETVGRFAINTTVGVGGVLDVAKTKTFKLPYRANGFANSLAYYGVKPGPFFYLPMIGATTLRDLFGRGMDAFASPVQALSGPTSAYAYSSTVVKSLDKRIENDDRIRAFRAENNQYAAARDMYLRRREAEIAELHGRKLDTGTPEQEVAQR